MNGEFAYKFHLSSIQVIILLLCCFAELILLKLFVKKTTSVRKKSFIGISSPTKEKDLPKWLKHLVLLTKTVTNKNEDVDGLIQGFILRTVLYFVGTYMILGNYTHTFDNFTISNLFNKWLIAVSLISGSLPYAVLRIKLHRIRVRNSYDLVPAAKLLYQKYCNNENNLSHAVIDITKELKGDIQLAFMDLIPVLQASNSRTIEKGLELFYFRIQTNWSIQLGLLIQKAEAQGNDIEKGLNRLVTDMLRVQDLLSYKHPVID